MDVKFISKETKLGESTQEKIVKKLELRFGKYFNDESSEIFVKVGKSKNMVKVELSMPYYGYKLRAESSSSDGVFSAFDRSVDIMERQMEKCKTKVNRSRYDSIKNLEPISGGEPLKKDGPDYNVVRTKAYEMKPMSVQEAILQMELLGHNFFMFCNTENKVCTVYRRDDGDYGLIEIV